MAEVTLHVGGHAYKVACRDGEEDHLRRLAAFVDGKIVEARSAVGDLSEVRQLLLAALLLADEQIDAQNRTDTAPDISSAYAETFESIANRIEALANALENSHRPPYIP
jgi:cell division protein ZapA